MLVDIANEQAKKNNVTIIVIHNAVDREVISALSTKVTLIRFEQPPPTLIPWFAFRLWRLIYEINSDIVHIHNKSTLKLFPPLVKKNLPETEYFFTIHTTGVLFGREINNADRLFAISNAVRNDMNMRVGCKDIEVVYNGVKCDAFSQKDNFSMPTKFKIIQIGRLAHEIKGQDILVKSLSILENTLKDLNIEITFVGDGASLSLLKKMAIDLGLEKRVFFLGIKTKEWIYKNLKYYDLLIQPSRIEGFGLTIVEGMTAKVPVLVSNIEGPMEVINDGEYGYFFERNDSHDCANKILEIIMEYQKGIIKIKTSKTYHYAIKKFDIGATADRYTELKAPII